MMLHFLKNRTVLLALCMALLLTALSPEALAAARPFSIRYTANTNGNIQQTGNTVMVSTGTCNGYNNSNCNMTNFDGDSDPTTFNSSSANIAIPSGSTILWAGLYWGARSASPYIGEVLFKTPASFGYNAITASQLDIPAPSGQTNEYGGFADVTSLVRAGGSGTYWVGNIQTTVNATGGITGQWGGWGLIVAYANNNEALNNITIYDGYQVISGTATMNVSGFLTPLTGPVNTRLGVVAWDGDYGSYAGGGIYTGDSLQVNGVGVYDNCNPVSNDFFNSSICNLGSPNENRYPNDYTIPGMPNTMGVDVDLVQLASGIVTNGATAAKLSFFTNGETYGAAALAFVTNLYVPVVTPNVVKTVADLTSSNWAIGDRLRYTITMSNTGQDTATNVVMSDNIPPYTTYVPNSLNIINGANAGAKTDASGDDQAEYLSGGTPRVVFRLGTGATSSVGGNLPYYTLASPPQTSLSFDVTINNNIPSGTLLSNQALISYSGQTLPGNTYSTTTSAATAYVLTPAVISKSFSPATINVNGVSQMNIVVSNPANNPAAINGVTFSDTYPSGLVNASPANPAITCTPGSAAGTLSGGVAGGNSIGLSSGATLAVGGSCTITVNVTSATVGNYSNTTSATSSTNAGSNTGATAVLSVGKPSISKAFATNPILVGATSRLTLTVNNVLASALSGIAFTDTYPAGLVNAAVPNAATTCGGTVLATAGANVINLSAGSVAAIGTCTISVDVTSSTAGVYANTSDGVSSTQTGTVGNGSNTASLTVIGPAQATMTYSPPSTRINLDTQLIITISNPNTTTALTGVSFTDTYPSLLLNTTNPSATLNCTSGSTATRTGGVASGSTIGISGGTLAPGGSCTVVINVSSTTAGSYVNSTGLITSANGSTGAGATNTLVVSNLVAPTLTKAFAPASIAVNGTSVLTITLQNANAVSITNATVTDTYPLGVVNAAAPAASTTCGGSLVAVPGANSVSLSGGTILATPDCTITVTVTSSSPSNYNNTIPAGALTSANAGDNAAGASAVLTAVSPPVIEKSFATNPVAINTNDTLTITITNPNTVATLNGIAFTDTYPAGLINATGGTTANTCGGTAAVDTTAPTYGVTLTGVTLAAGASCTVSYNRVQAAAAGAYVNTTSAVTSTNGGTGNTASDTLSVGQPGISKAFATTPINFNGTSVLTITLSNPTATAMTAAAFTDTYPSGMTNAAAPAAATTCGGGTVTAAGNGSSVALSSGTIPANATCKVTVTVTASTSGTNTIAAGALTVSGPASNINSASANLDVNPAPVISKSFSPASIPLNGASTLTITVQNNNGATMTGVAFSDSYPSGLVNTAAPAVTATPATCTYTTLSAAAGGNSFVLTGGSIPLNTACVYTVQVTSATAGNYVNSTGAVTSTNFSTGSAASATLTVTASSPTATKAFSPATINAGATSLMTITLTNPNATTAITGAAFTDTYPSGLTNTGSANAATTCVGTVTAANNGNSVQLSGATIPAGGSCTVTVNVTSALGGIYTNSTGTVTTTNANSGTAATAVLTVIGPPTVSKAFATSPILSGASSVLTITLTNPNAAAALSGLAFTDTYPANITNTAAPAAATTCTGGTVTAAANGPSVALSGGTLAAGASCTVTVTVTGTIGGTYTNTIPDGGVSSNVGASAAAAWANLTVYPPPTVTKTFTPTSQVVNTNGTLTITLTNSTPVAMTGAAFTDNYPPGLINQNGGTVTNTCGGTVPAPANNSTVLSLTGGTIPANGSCTVSYTRVKSATAGAYLNNTGSVTTTNGGTGASASAMLSVGQPTIGKAFAASTIVKGTNTTLTFTLDNPTAGNYTGAAFTDTYPVGITNAATPGVVNGCGGTVIAAANGGSIAYSGGTIPGAGCTIVVTITGTAGGVYTNTVPVGGLTVTGPSAQSNGIAASAVLTVMGLPAVTKTFSPNLVGLGASSNMTITLTNPNTATAITGAAFTDTYPADLVNNGGLVNNCGGSTTAGAGNPGTLTLSGGTIPAGGSCTISILVTSSTAASYTNTLGIGSVTTANSGSNAVAASGSLSIFSAPSLTLLKTVAIYSDPVNLLVNPKYIPGAIAQYTITTSNSGGPADANSIFITDAAPPNTALYVNDIGGAGSGPVLFTQGSTSSTLSYVFTSLNSNTDNLSFSNNGGASWIYAPTAGANGCDPAVTNIRINPQGTFIGGSPNPSFQLIFRVCVQ